MIKEPLTQEDIGKEIRSRLDEPDNQWDSIFNSGFSRGFSEATEWRINSVWHYIDKELPEYNKRIVNEDWFDFIPKDEKDLKRIISEYQFKRWAYVEDLLPNKQG